MESQPLNPEFRKTPENCHPFNLQYAYKMLTIFRFEWPIVFRSTDNKSEKLYNPPNSAFQNREFRNISENFRPCILITIKHLPNATF